MTTPPLPERPHRTARHTHTAQGWRIPLVAWACLAGVGCTGPTQTAGPSTSDALTRTFLLDCATTGARLVCVGERNTILLSDDSGTSWRRAQTPAARLLTAVHFNEPQLGWAVGHDGLILHTRDAGETWHVQYQLRDKTLPLFDVNFSDATHGISVGAFGTYALTDDGGNTWTERRLDDADPHLYAIARTLSGELWACGEAGTLLRSGDSGQTWRTMALPVKGGLFGIVALGTQTIVAYGLSGTVAQSFDGGRSWQVQQLPTQESIQAADGSEHPGLLLASADGRLWRHNSGDAGFSVIATAIGPTAHVRRIADNEILAVGPSGLMRLSLPRPVPERSPAH